MNQENKKKRQNWIHCDFLPRSITTNKSVLSNNHVALRLNKCILIINFSFFHSCVIFFIFYFFWLSRLYLHTKSLTFSSCLFRPSNFSFRQFWLFTFQYIHVSPLILCIVSLWSLLNFFPSEFDPFIQCFTDPTTSKSFHIGPRSSIIIWIWSFESFKKCEDQSRHFPNIKFILETCEFTLIPILLIIKYVQFD